MTVDVLTQLRERRAGTAAIPEQTAPTAPRVGAYTRISDSYEGRETGVTTEGVDRQQAACEHIALARGWDIAAA